jgi:hypothetical protein
LICRRFRRFPTKNAVTGPTAGRRGGVARAHYTLGF